MGNIPSYYNAVPSWQLLPEELVMLILDKLVESIDYARFAAVCKDWYRIAKVKYTQDTDRWYHRPRPPMLLLPSPALDRSLLLNFCQTTVYGKKNCLRVPREYRSGSKFFEFRCGAGHGWLAKVVIHCDDDVLVSERVWKIELVNPFRQATTLTIPLLTLDRGKYVSRPKVILSSDPALNPDSLWFVAFLTGGHELSFHKRGEENWISLKRRGAGYTDAIFYKGRFYAIDNLVGCILSFDIEDAKSCVFKIDGFERHSTRSYLVESTKGDLLCLTRFVIQLSEDCYKTRSFKVYKLELENRSSSSTITQVEVTNIEDETIFIGDTPSVSVLASNFSGCRPNSIYFTDDSVTPDLAVEMSFQYHPQEGIEYDGGIFSLADKSITPIFTCRHFSSPSWITTAPPFDPSPGFNLTEWANPLELTPIGRELIEKEDKKKRRHKHWLGCFSTNE